MAALSTFVTIINNTSLELELEKHSLSQGQWSDGQDPPSRIAPYNRGTLQAESTRYRTGDEGFLIYSSDAGSFTFNFDNPYNGFNSYDQSAPDGYTISRFGGRGEISSVTWIIGTCYHLDKFPLWIGS